MTLLFRKCLLNWAALLDRHIPTSSAIAATILEIVTELHFILDSFSEVVRFVNSIFGRFCIRCFNSHYVTVRSNKPGALCLVLLRECFPPLDEQTYTYSDVGFTKIQKCPITTHLSPRVQTFLRKSRHTLTSPFPFPSFPLPSSVILNCLEKFGLKLQKLFYLSCFVLHCFFAYSNFIVTRFRLRIQMSCLATSSCSNFQKLISQFPRSPSHCQHATSEDM